MTAKRVLVPLKGTAADEAVLSVVAPAASAVGATLRLLHVAPLPHNLFSESGRVVMYADQEMARLDAHWLAYLTGVAATLPGTASECIVRFGEPWREILAEAEAWGAELIALTKPRTRRVEWSGFRQTLTRVARKARIPLLLYQGA